MQRKHGNLRTKDVIDRFNDAFTRVEDMFVEGDRAAVAWTYRWRSGDETADDPGYVRGVDLFRVRDGKVVEKLSYVKG